MLKIIPNIEYKERDRNNVIKFKSPFGHGCIQVYERERGDEYFMIIVSEDYEWDEYKRYESLEHAKVAIFNHAMLKIKDIIDQCTLQMVG